MKKVYLVHGWGGTGSGGWFDWVKRELKGKAEVYSFDMPDTDNPKIETWVGFLQENVKEVDEETYFIGHSIGCQIILRFLERLPKDAKVGGCVFVGGFFSDLLLAPEEDVKIVAPWLKTEIDTTNVKKHCSRFLAIFSDDDPFVPLSNEKMFKERLGARIIVKKGQEHFCMVEKIPEVLDFLNSF